MASPSPYGALSANVHQAMDELDADESVYVPQREAEELFHLPDCVHIFFITGDGRVSTFSEPSTLRIFRFKEAQGDEQDRPTFIQVAGWTHPLVPGVSPVLEAGNGAFMFPDVYGVEAGSSVGIVIADDSPFNVDDAAQIQLAQILQQLTTGLLKREERLSNDQRLGKIGKTLVWSAEKLSAAIEKGAEKTTQLIEYAGEKQMAKVAPNDQEAKISPALKYTIKGAGYATNATVKVSGFVANRVGKLTKGLANHLAKKMEPTVTGSLTTATGGSKTKSSSMHNIVDAARGGLLAYGTVYAGLEGSAKVLGRSMKDQSVQVVEKKYGNEAGGAYGEAMTAAGDAAMTYMNIQSLGVKGMVKRTAKQTGKQLGKSVLEAHVDKKAKVDDNDNGP